ncbi:MAG: hypothetical protein R3Y64_10225, partial [Peptostreptococcaceae bacterium]
SFKRDIKDEINDKVRYDGNIYEIEKKLKDRDESIERLKKSNDESIERFKYNEGKLEKSRDEYKRERDECKKELEETKNEKLKLVSNFNDIKREKEKIEKDLGLIDDRLKSAIYEKNNLKYDLDKINEDLDRKDQLLSKSKYDNDTLTEKLSIIKDEKQQLQELVKNKDKEIKDKEEEINNLEKLKGSLRSELVDTKQKLETRTNELDNMKEVKDSLSEKLSEEVANLKEANSKNEHLEGKFGNFDEVTKPYIDVMGFVYKCKSLHNIIVKNRLEQDEDKIYDTNNILKFIGVFGVETKFAEEVYSTLKDYKKNNQEYLAVEETYLIKSLNSFYKLKYDIEFDILDDLGIKADDKFDKMKMQDMKRPSITAFHSIDGLYVPSLYSLDQKMKFKSIVGAN